MKRVAVALFGGLLLVIGVALLVLPGPGFLLIFAALAVLATQFDWARKYVDRARRKAQAGVDEVASSPLRAMLTIGCAVLLMAVGVLDLVGVDIPLVNTLTAVLLVLSGLFLIGTVGYALLRPHPSGNSLIGGR